MKDVLEEWRGKRGSERDTGDSVKNVKRAAYQDELQQALGRPPISPG